MVDLIKIHWLGLKYMSSINSIQQTSIVRLWVRFCRLGSIQYETE